MRCHKQDATIPLRNSTEFLENVATSIQCKPKINLCKIMIIYESPPQSIAIGFPVHTQPSGRQNRNIISIILTFSLVVYPFMTKLYFWSLPLYTGSHFPKAVRGKSSNPYDCYFLRNIFSPVTVNFFINFRPSIA